MKKHILVISQYFYPEQFRINDICAEWVQRGYRVTVVTGIPNYPQGNYYEGYGIFKKRRESYKGVDIVRIPLVPRGNNIIMLSLNYLSFVITGLIWKIFTKTKADYVFIYEVSPMTQALPGIWYAQKRKIPCYLYVQDLWPENVKTVTGISNRVIITPIETMVKYIYRRCTKIFVTSQSFVSSICEYNVSKEKIEYWPQYAEEFYMPLKKQSIEEIARGNTFNIIFTGNIGTAQGLDILPDVAELLEKKNLKRSLRFNIVGDGRYKKALQQKISAKNVQHMFNFIPKQFASEIPKFMAACDVALLCLSDDRIFDMTIPAKLQSYMACGMPIVASARGEVCNIIHEAKAGLCSIPGRAEDLGESIITMMEKNTEELQIMGENARNYSNENFNKRKLLDKIDEYFNV